MKECAVLCCAVLCCAVLCCAVLCCAVLCCAVLCWCHLNSLQELTSRNVCTIRFFMVRLLRPAMADTTWPGRNCLAALMAYTDLDHKRSQSHRWW